MDFDDTVHTVPRNLPSKLSAAPNSIVYRVSATLRTSFSTSNGTYPVNPKPLDLHICTGQVASSLIRLDAEGTDMTGRFIFSMPVWTLVSTVHT